MILPAQPTTVTKKGQVTIPVSLRKKLNITSGTKVNFVYENGQIVLKPIPDFRSLRGIIKTDKKYNKKEIERAIGDHIKEEWGKKMKRCA